MSAYTTRFDDALLFTSTLHRAQTRKGSEVPYITHLLGVAAIVGDVGGSEDQVIGALLHDAIEDHIEDHPQLPHTIEQTFGAVVLAIVLACSDTVTHPKPPWVERKRAYIQHVLDADDDDPALLVSLADKLYNGLTLLRDARLHGPSLWTRFKSTPEQALWYYTELASAFSKKSWPTETQRALCDDYARLVKELGHVIHGF